MIRLRISNCNYWLTKPDWLTDNIIRGMFIDGLPIAHEFKIREIPVFNINSCHYVNPSDIPHIYTFTCWKIAREFFFVHPSGWMVSKEGLFFVFNPEAFAKNNDELVAHMMQELER